MTTTAVKSHHEIVVFDFDGTITTQDTFALFLRYYAGTAKWVLNIAILLPVFLAYILKLINRDAVKASVIRRFFKGADVKALNEKAARFAKDVIPPLVRPMAQEELNKKKLNGEPLYICSASISPYLNVWAESQSIEKVMATDLKQRDGRYTGEIDGWNVWGAGKVRRIESEFAPDTVSIKEAYGDTRGDQEMLHAADVSHWRPFRLSEHRD